MIRSILLLLALGLLGMAVLGIVFGFLAPLIMLVAKIALVLLLGYLVLRLISPERADEVRDRLRKMS